ncbi:MAG: response regulator [Anaerolineae bacterium]|nr:response regulator [Anaerolineae bacterium]
MKPTSSQVSKHAVSPPTTDGKKRVLIVDDEEHVLFILHGALARLGDCCEVVAVADGWTALEQARQQPIDLLLTDLRMPGLDGVALTEQVRALYPRIVVIWMTAYGSATLREQAERLGIYGCLDKPVEVSDIRSMVRQALSKT